LKFFPSSTLFLPLPLRNQCWAETRSVTFSPTSGLCFDTGDGYFKAPLRTLLACKGVYPSSEELLGSESAGKSCSEEGEESGVGDGISGQSHERLKVNWE